MTTQTKYIRGCKRLQIIQKWLNGHDDPNYEVLPTKTEGKYIVKKKAITTPEATDSQNDVHLNEESNEESNEPIRESSSIPTLPSTPLKRTIKQTKTPSTDSTVNLEILEQLRMLGDELRAQRQKKEQKQLIKQVVNKQLTKKSIKRAVIKEESTDDDDEENDNEENNETTTTTNTDTLPQFKSRIRR